LRRWKQQNFHGGVLERKKLHRELWRPDKRSLLVFASAKTSMLSMYNDYARRTPGKVPQLKQGGEWFAAHQPEWRAFIICGSYKSLSPY
jgi:hypothetical protein